MTAGAARVGRADRTCCEGRMGSEQPSGIISAYCPTESLLKPAAILTCLLLLCASVAVPQTAPQNDSQGAGAPRTAPQVTPRAAPQVAPSAAPQVAPSAASQAVSLIAQDAWIRFTPGTDMAAAYLTLRNVSAAAVVVTGIHTPLAGHAMIHETRVEGGQARMRPHEPLTIEAGKTVRLEPGGLHVMLHDLTGKLVPGQSVPLVIEIEGGGALHVSAPVRPPGAE